MGILIATGAILNVIAYVIWLRGTMEEIFNPSNVFSPDVIQLALWAAGMGATIFTAAKALPGSPELTDIEDRKHDKTINQVKSKEEDLDL